MATDRQHLDIQREEISSFAAAKDIHVDKWVMEVSGEKAKQPGPKLKLVLERLKKGDALIVSDITRLCLTLYVVDGDTYRLHGEGRDGLLYKRPLYIR